MRKIISGAFTVALLAVFLFLLFVALTRAQTSSVVATGGPYALEKTAVAGGGSEKQNAPLSENGTAGQAVAGTTSTGGPYSLYSGFWTPDFLVPTAARVNVGGRTTDAAGTGLRNVTVRLTSQTGEIKTALSSSLGYYEFEEVEVGATYLISVSSRRYTFAEPTRAVQVGDSVSDVNFIGSMGN